MLVGLDDTDSREGMCTTYLCARIIAALEDSAAIEGLPRLVRLNPNIPYKTRGNGALAFAVHGDPDVVWETVTDMIAASRMPGPDTNPGAILLDAPSPPPVLEAFYRRALHEEVGIDEAKELALHLGARLFFCGNGRGIIGALAAVGARITSPTYELIAYRELGSIGTPRYVDALSVSDMDAALYPSVFDSYDARNGYVAIAPRSPCPVLYGIRGTSREAVCSAAAMVRSEPVSFSQVFETNQATDAHIEDADTAGLRRYRSVRLRGRVSDAPHDVHHGHVFFSLSDGVGSVICAAYEPTKEFRTVVRALAVGDDLTVWGGVMETPFGLTINLEKLEIHTLASLVRPVVPKCCGTSMQSIGLSQGYRCRRCGAKVPWDAVSKVAVERGVHPGRYEVPVIARRHLARPLALMPCP